MIATLFQLGAIQFQVIPVNIQAVERETGGDYAAKDVVGARRPQEYMGPSDDTVTLSGCVFPQKFGGLSGITALQAMAEAGVPQMLVRGDGSVFGWYILKRVSETNGYLDALGVGRFIEFEVELVRSPLGPSVAGMLSMLTSIFG